MSKRFPSIATYMMASRPHGVIYIGVTGDLLKRAFEHREGLVEGFTKRYSCKMLVWYEPHQMNANTIQREKSLKRWKRVWKIALIEKTNPDWVDLYPTLNL